MEIKTILASSQVRDSRQQEVGWTRVETIIYRYHVVLAKINYCII